jgi:DNA-binding NtrC family response regulator
MAADFLSSLGHAVDEAGTLEQALGRVRARPYDLVLSDLILEPGTGLELLQVMKAEEIPAEVMIMTGYGGVEAAVEAMRQGAYDFVTKPLDLRRLEFDVKKALEKRRLEEDLLRARAPQREGFGQLVGVSHAMREVFALLERAAGSEANVLLVGPSGTGKELAARAIHDRSARAAGPFVALDCGTLSGELVESRLWGHARGAFTGALADQRGAFREAEGGTLFLDEIAAAPSRTQAALLRVLQERVLRPLGSEGEVEIDVRVIAATNADLDDALAEGAFRQDLYYRLAGILVRMPPLAERPEDVPVLVDALLREHARRHGRDVSISPRALERLVHQSWPGNVRELAHCLEQAVVATEGSVVRARDLPLDAEREARLPTLEEVERKHIERVLKATGWNKLRASAVLGIPRATLYRKLSRYGLDGTRPEGSPRGAGEDAVAERAGSVNE